MVQQLQFPEPYAWLNWNLLSSAGQLFHTKMMFWSEPYELGATLCFVYLNL